MTPNPNPSPELRTRLKYYPDYIDDPDGLERFRQAVLSNSGHDMAAVNHNSLGRLIDTIERLRRERDAALSQTLPAPGEVDYAEAARAIFEACPDRFMRAEQCHPAIDALAQAGFFATVAAANDEGVAAAASEALEGIVEHAETRIQDGIEMGATVWRLALEDIVRDARAAIRLLSQGAGK